ncbi:DUF4292 domain-containing protein, partial [Flavobacteriaceae bacterium]|nr:DUF4292 domain-containing protein [Flavobacteriaceae bacterium]
MNNKTGKIFILSSLLLLFFLEGCSTKKKILSDLPSNDIEVSEIIKNSKKSELKFQNLRNRVKVEFNDGRSTQSVSLSLRALDQELIWISASMIVPIAKILLSNERVVFYEKFQKTYINQEIDLIMSALGIKNPVKSFQNLLLGKSILDISRGSWERVENPNYYVLKSSKGIQSSLFINPKTFHLDQQRVFIPLLSSLITIDYNNYKTIEDKIVPNNVLISYMRGNKIIKINLQYSQFDFP